ncbi:hypothetical protein DL240_15095 [Lujinxingia litoralis]|uniref:Uncharacterized protein n=1 Tax=Lujinxingia litoralis TaxID=2211119 RepID=A0A328C4R9_9DELT|nr:hypothetical protein [Lujinxingia litoralis]RAL20994.1 hypothetical protein DL240_15095 [Lujinxingia litoralis]
MDLTYKIVRRLLRDDDVAFSRNRNFEAYQDARVQRALRLYRHLRSLERDLLRLESGDEVRLEAVEREGDEVTVRLEFLERKGKRISYLNAREWGLLLESKRVCDILARLLEHSTPAVRRALGQEQAGAPGTGNEDELNNDASEEVM